MAERRLAAILNTLTADMVGYSRLSLLVQNVHSSPSQQNTKADAGAKLVRSMQVVEQSTEEIMRKAISGAIIVLPLLTAAQGAWAFDCSNRFALAETAIADATAAMEKMNGAIAKGLVHTLIDDAKMKLHSAKHNHEKPAAGKYDHGRAIAKANAAEGYARAALLLASKY